MLRQFRFTPRVRFGLGLLLFAMLWAAGYCGGYRYGYDSGRRSRFRDSVQSVSYDVEDLLGPDFSQRGMRRTADQLKKLIEALAPDRWGPPHVVDAVVVSPDFCRLEVTGYGTQHEQTVQLLDQLRQSRK